MENTVFIPVGLKPLPQWVTYLLLPKAGGKPTKIPINPKTGAYANVSDPATWGTFDQACTRLHEDRRLSGIGFVFSASDEFLGLDFDACRDPRSGEIDPSVMVLVTELNSYTEISVSGTGLHIIVAARLAQGGCRQGRIEIYDQRRFFVVTGMHLNGTPTEIYPRQAQVNRLHQTLFTQRSNAEFKKPHCKPLVVDDQTLVMRIQASPQADKFGRLLGGSTVGYDSHSQADLALCAILATWTRDEQQIDRIFRASGLYRDKWDASRGETTYGSLTILRALGRR